jgi:hypothetical protein
VTNILDIDLDLCDASVDFENILEEFAHEVIYSYLVISGGCAIEALFEAMAWRAGGILSHEDLFGVANGDCALFGAVECVEAEHADLGIKLYGVSHRKHLCDEGIFDGLDKSCDGWYFCQPCVKCLHPYDVVVTWMLLICDRDGVNSRYYLRVGIMYRENEGLDRVECWEDKNWVGSMDALLSKIRSAFDEIKISNALRDR